MIRSWKDIRVNLLARVFEPVSPYSVVHVCSSESVEVLISSLFLNQLLAIGLKSLIGFALLFEPFVFMVVKKNEVR